VTISIHQRTVRRLMYLIICKAVESKQKVNHHVQGHLKVQDVSHARGCQDHRALPTFRSDLVIQVFMLP
jgi:hypothetical protein